MRKTFDNALLIASLGAAIILAASLIRGHQLEITDVDEVCLDIRSTKCNLDDEDRVDTVCMFEAYKVGPDSVCIGPSCEKFLKSYRERVELEWQTTIFRVCSEK